MPSPMIGSELAVQDTTMSNRSSSSGSSASRMVRAPNRSASRWARSSVRLATVIDRGSAAARTTGPSTTPSTALPRTPTMVPSLTAMSTPQPLLHNTHADCTHRSTSSSASPSART